MDDINKNQRNPVGGALGALPEGWSDTNRDVVNPEDHALNRDLDREITPGMSEDAGMLDDEEDDDLDLTDATGGLDDPTYSELDEDEEDEDEDDILPLDQMNPEIGDERDNRLIHDPMLDEEDPAEDPYLPPR